MDCISLKLNSEVSLNSIISRLLNVSLLTCCNYSIFLTQKSIRDSTKEFMANIDIPLDFVKDFNCTNEEEKVVVRIIFQNDKLHYSEELILLNSLVTHVKFYGREDIFNGILILNYNFLYNDATFLNCINQEIPYELIKRDVDKGSSDFTYASIDPDNPMEYTNDTVRVDGIPVKPWFSKLNKLY